MILTLTIWTICQSAKAHKADVEQMVSLVVFMGIGHLVRKTRTHIENLFCGTPGWLSG